MKANDLKIEVIAPPNKGGQQCGVPVCSVRVTHIPTQISAEVKFERSQLRNKKVAIAMIEYGLAEIGWREPK